MDKQATWRYALLYLVLTVLLWVGFTLGYAALAMQGLGFARCVMGVLIFIIASYVTMACFKWRCTRRAEASELVRFALWIWPLNTVVLIYALLTTPILSTVAVLILLPLVLMMVLPAIAMLFFAGYGLNLIFSLLMNNRVIVLRRILVMCFVVVAAAAITFIKLDRMHHYGPRINPYAKYFMTIKGRIAPSLVGKVKLTWQSTFSTTARACSPHLYYVEGSPSSRSKTFKYHFKPNKKGYFTGRIPLDHLLTGLCQWRNVGVSYDFVKPYNNFDYNGFRVVSFMNKSHHKNNRIKQVWLCKENKPCSVKFSNLKGSYERNKNYIYHIKILGE